MLELRCARRCQGSQGHCIVRAGYGNLCSPRRRRDKLQVPVAPDKGERFAEPPPVVLLRQQPVEPLSRQRHAPRLKLK